MGSAIDSIFGSTGEGGTNAGNYFAGSNLKGKPQQYSADDQQWRANQALTNALQYGPEQAAKDVQSNPMLSQLFGKGGQMENTGNEINNLQNQGFKLTADDQDAYGQASGNIARMFDQNDQSLASALSARGLSSSGVAGQQFATSLGNKNEQLAQQQLGIARERFNQNINRLGQARQYMTQLGGQAQGAMGQAMNEKNTQAQQGQEYIGNLQNAANQNLAQYQQTNHATGLGQLAGTAAQAAANYYTGGLAGAGGGTTNFSLGGAGSGPVSGNSGGYGLGVDMGMFKK